MEKKGAGRKPGKEAGKQKIRIGETVKKKTGAEAKDKRTLKPEAKPKPAGGEKPSDPIPEKPHIADFIATAVRDQPEVAKAILGQIDIKTIRDLAKLNVTKLIKRIAPDAKVGTKAYEQAKSQATAINRQSFVREPLTVLHRMTQEGELPVADEKVRIGLGTFLQRIPAGTNIRLTPIHKVLTKEALKDVPEEQRAAVTDYAKALWRTMAITPHDAPHVPPALIKANLTSAFDIGEKPESTFIKTYSKSMGKEVAQQVYTNAINTRIRNEHALMTIREAVKGTGLAAIDGPQKMETRKELFNSVASRNDAPLNLDALFGGMDYCERKDCESVYSASSYFVELLNFLRNNNLGPDPATGNSNPNIHPGIAGTPLEKLFRRRPDLGDLELSCENTNTVLPYIDLVNEVMESYVVHRAGLGESEPKLDAFNITDETKDELLAQPQHTNYLAYCILKNAAVYPFTLPFHQPIEAARIFLKYLGTSRHEVLDSFRSTNTVIEWSLDDCELPPDTMTSLHHRARLLGRPGSLGEFNDKPAGMDHMIEEQKLRELYKNVVLNRAVDAEYLGLTQEEYIILTKEAFWPKEYFEITQETTIEDEQYRKNIGVKQLCEYYGYKIEEVKPDKNGIPDLGNTDLCFVKKAFLPRTGIQYTDLVELLKTRFINPDCPQGIALSIFENIRSSYGFLLTLIDTSSTDQNIRFAGLIDFLEYKQSWKSVPRVDKAFTNIASPEHGTFRANPIIRQWVYSCFEKLGKLIVLESGEGPRLPIEGLLYIGEARTPFAKLRSDGTIVNPSDNDLLVGRVTAKSENDVKGYPRMFTGPVAWTRPEWGSDNITIKDENGRTIGKINSDGVWRYQIEIFIRVKWISPKETCNLDKVRLIHFDGTPVTVDEFDRMQRFIRLWRKLGWSIDEVDKALEGLAARLLASVVPMRNAIIPPFDRPVVDGPIVDRPPVFRPPFGGLGVGDTKAVCDITPAFLHQLTAVKKLLELTGLPLIKLLSFWADISTAGEKSLYSRLFLSHNMVGIDDVFKEDDNGNYLAGPEKIVDHLPVLMAALKLKADDITAIAGSSDTLLIMENVSEIYRHGLLAKALHIKASDLADLKKVFGEPFADADTTLKLFETWKKMEDSGFTFRQLTYVIEGLDDVQKPLAPSQKTMLQIAKTLYDGLNAIESDNKDVTDVEQATTELVRTKAGLLFEAPMVEKIVGLLEGTMVYTTNAPSGLQIVIPKPQPTWASKLKYKDSTDGSSIQMTGILTVDDEQKDVNDLFPGNSGWSDAIDRVRNQARAFFKDAFVGIFTDEGKDDKANKQAIDEAEAILLAGDILVPGDQIKPGAKDPNTAPWKRFFFLRHFLPLLRQRLERRFIEDALSAAFGLTGDVTNDLLSHVLFTKEATPQSAMSVLETIRASRPQAGKGWTGYLIPPAEDNYTFVAYAPDPNNPDTPPAPLTIQGFQDAVAFKYQQADPTNVWSTDPVPLKAGMPCLLTIADGNVSQLKWRTTALPATQIPTSALLPDDTTAGTAGIFKQFSKAAIVVNGFNLSADEVRYFQAHGDDFDVFDFNAVTLKAWLRIADYAALRKNLPKAGIPLLELFKWTSQPDDKTIAQKLNEVTQWGQNRTDALIAPHHFNLQQRTDFNNEGNLLKMQKAIAVADKVGVDIDRLFYWAVPGSKFWQCHYIAEDIRMAMRARFDAEDFEQAVKPLSDQLREMQKQALTAFLLTQSDLKAWPVVDADSLFEFFLIDVQMGAERETSRMVQALASVQLFIKRCLMGLEDKTDEHGNQIGVPCDAIDRERWEWMQKYRVWEANRKVFLYPENWIRPELRDDKSPFYKELESELLQKDINTQTVTEALKNYLYKVDEVANLKVVGLFIKPATDKDGQESKDDNEKTIYTKLHVFARTRNAPYFFFYRYFDIGESNWYPWEKMQVDIPSYDVEEVIDGKKTGKITENGTYLIPVVWNNRLLVFFPQFMKKTVPAAPDKTVRDMAESSSDSLKPTEMWEIKMAWSEYRKGKWTQKQVSTEAIFNKITSNDHVGSYLFIPTIVEKQPVIIDVYHEDEHVYQKPAVLDSVTLTLTSVDNQFPVTIKKVQVNSLIDGSCIATLSMPVTHITQTEVRLNSDSSIPAKTIEQCRSFSVDIDTDNAYLYLYFIINAKIELHFSDNSKLPLNMILRPQQGVQSFRKALIEPHGPRLSDINLQIESIDDNTSTFNISIRDINGTEFARNLGVAKKPSKKYDISIQPLNEKSNISKAECQEFKVIISVDISRGFGSHLQNYEWRFDATVTLTFEGEPPTTFQASKKDIFLKDYFADDINDLTSFSFSSSDSYQYPQPEEPKDPSEGVDVAISKRFQFSGNQISIVPIPIGALVLNLISNGHRFHYRDAYMFKRDAQNKVIAIPAKTTVSLKLVSSENVTILDDTQPAYFEPTQEYYTVPSELQMRLKHVASNPFSAPSMPKLLATLDTDKLDGLFEEYLNQADIIGIYGSYSADGVGNAYHELKQPYSLYNWEVCFHAPMQLVEHLLKSQQFDQALEMCHYIFNPLAKSGDYEKITKRCWQFPPFKDIDPKHVLENLFNDLKPGTPDKKINEWRDKPFQPHVVARNRPSAYMKFVVMKYIEILIAYGDYYFRQNSMEAIPMAIQCYVMASHLYGPRGQKIPRRGKIEKQTYNSLLDKWDAFGNAMVEMELVFPFINQTVNLGSAGVGLVNLFGSMSTLYFGIPNNPNLTALRDTIDDRLFKIRHCQDIEGVFRQLPLFEPPIDPALLVQAAAQGLSLSSVLNDMNSPMPNYRFYYLLQKALELCSELKSLGSAFLSAKEKRDAEYLANLRAKHESGIHNLVMEVKKQQLEEAQKSLNALQQSRKGPESRMQYYLQLIGEELSKMPGESDDFDDLPNQLEKPIDESGLKLIRYEKEEMDKAKEAADLQIAIGIVEILASTMHIMPDAATDIKPWGIGAGLTIGGTNFGNSIQAVARGLQIHASQLSHQSSSASRKSGFLRQLQDRVQQANAAGYEIKNIDKQILTQQIRIAIANLEVSNQQKQIDNVQEVEEFLKNKYTNEELYSWMEGEIRTLYRQAYNLAYDLAKKAEKAYRFERGLTESNFIQYGYWDAGRDGLLAGERLHLALKQLEAVYQEKRGYDFEVTKHVSLRQINPLELLKLRESGTCEFFMPEVLFDMDFPGHYMRRIKSVALTVPCVVGPYTSLNCTLRLMEHKFRTKAIVSPGYAETTDETDERFSTVNVPITAIAVSSGQNDSGVFELNFKDERYMPFEGAGAISKWRIELPKEFKQFDYDTISDVVMHIRYTARDGGTALATAAKKGIKEILNVIQLYQGETGLIELISLRHDFPTEWAKYLANKAAGLEITVGRHHFPYMFQSSITIKKLVVVSRENLAGSELTFTNAWLKLVIPDRILNGSHSPYLAVIYTI